MNVASEAAGAAATAAEKPIRPGQDYKHHDPRGWCGNPLRGAALGRPTIDVDAPLEWVGKLYVSRIYLDNGGYDKNGTYFGHGEPLFWVRSADYEIDYMTRATSRTIAVWLTAKEYPKATFARGLSAEEAAWAQRMLGDA